MHLALQIEEILLDIFSFCYVPIYRYGQRHLNPRRLSYANIHLAALARTCRTFKEPALDMLWAELTDLTPLVRCLPETSWVKLREGYSLKRRLKQWEWHIILGYASRVRALPRLYYSMGLTSDCVEELSKSPDFSGPSILPNLRVVGLYGRTTARLIGPFVRHLASPSLTKLTLSTENLSAIIAAFGNRCPIVADFGVMHLPDAEADAISRLICRWQSLTSVECYGVCLNVDALVHLSRLWTLTSLVLRVDDAATQFFIPQLTFSALRTLALQSKSLTLAQKFFHHLTVPGIHDLIITIFSRPTPSDLTPLFVTLERACIRDVLTSFTLHTFLYEESPYLVSNITLDHIRPLSIFVNIKFIFLDAPFALDLNERELLSLASSWPHLEQFEVCKHHVWSTSSAITPGGFLQLLERCKSLRVLHFMLDTRGYTEIPQGHPWRGLSMPKDANIHLLNSLVEEESIEALGIFFHVAPHPYFKLDTYWSHPYSLYYSGEPPGELHDLYRKRWEAVFKLARDLWEKRRDLVHSLETRSSQRCL